MRIIILTGLILLLGQPIYSDNTRFSVQYRQDLPTFGLNKALVYIIKDIETNKKYLFISDGSTQTGGLTLLSE